MHTQKVEIRRLSPVQRKQLQKRRRLMKTVGEALAATVVGILAGAGLVFALFMEPTPVYSYQEKTIQVSEDYSIPASRYEAFQFERQAYQEAEFSGGIR